MVLLFCSYQLHYALTEIVSLVLLCIIMKMKIETLVLASLLQTLLFSVEIRGGQISTQTVVIA